MAVAGTMSTECFLMLQFPYKPVCCVPKGGDSMGAQVAKHFVFCWPFIKDHTRKWYKMHIQICSWLLYLLMSLMEKHQSNNNILCFLAFSWAFNRYIRPTKLRKTILLFRLIMSTVSRMREMAKFNKWWMVKSAKDYVSTNPKEMCYTSKVIYF